MFDSNLIRIQVGARGGKKKRIERRTEFSLSIWHPFLTVGSARLARALWLKKKIVTDRKLCDATVTGKIRILK